MTNMAGMEMFIHNRLQTELTAIRNELRIANRTQEGRNTLKQRRRDRRQQIQRQRRRDDEGCVIMVLTFAGIGMFMMIGRLFGF